MAKMITFLLYPWVDACLKMAYTEYLDAGGFNNFRFTEEDVVRHFMKHRVDDYMKIALKKHWARIIFMPWTIISSPELYEHRFDL
jgi:hypothetical protein